MAEVVSTFTANVSGYMSAMNQMKSATSNAMGGLNSSVAKGTSGIGKMGLAFGGAAGVGYAAFNMIKRGVTGLISEMNENNKAWQTFEGNMKILGKSQSQINAAQKSMSDYAKKTIYSASDMGSAYAQFAAVGVKGTGSLVKGLGGLAASAQNPKQAMKSLMEQGIQMAAKPMVQWQDFRIMLQQAPAAMSAVAKHMGMSTDELIAKIQDGTVSSKDFLKAMSETGNQKGFQDMATNYKSVGEALQGLAETIAIQTKPAFKALNSIAVGAISDIVNWISKLDFSKIGSQISSVFGGSGISTMLSTAKDMFTNFASAVGVIMSGVWDAISSLPWGTIFSTLGTAVTIAMGVLSGLFGFISQHQGAFKTLAVSVTAFIGAFKAIQGIMAFVSALKSIGTVITVVKSAWETFQILLMLNPFTIVIAAIAAVVAGLVYFFTQTKVGKQAWSDFTTWLSAKWTSIATAATTIWTSIVSFFANIWTQIVTTATTVWTNLTTLLSTIWTGIVTVVTTIFTGIGTFFSTLWTGIQTVVTTVWNAISTTITTVINVISSVISSVLSVISGVWSSIWSVVSSVASSIWNGIVSFITNYINNAKNNISNVLNAISSVWSSIWSSIAGVASSIWSGIVNTASSIFNGLVNIVSNIINSVKNTFNSLRSFSLADAGRAIINSFLNGLQSAFNSVKSFVSGIAGWIKSHKGPISYDKRLLIPAGNAIMNGFNGGLISQFDEVKRNVASMAGNLATVVQGATSDIAAGNLDVHSDIDKNVKSTLSQDERIEPAIYVNNELIGDKMTTTVNGHNARKDELNKLTGGA